MTGRLQIENCKLKIANWRRAGTLAGLGLSLLAVHLLAEPIGVWWSYAVGLSIGLAWNALLWLVRNWRLQKAA